jgi:hypothetical protein
MTAHERRTAWRTGADPRQATARRDGITIAECADILRVYGSTTRPLADVCLDAGLDYHAVHVMINNVKELKAAMKAANILRARAIADDSLMDVDDLSLSDGRAKTTADHKLRLAARLDRETYGDALSIDSAGPRVVVYTPDPQALKILYELRPIAPPDGGGQ